MQDQRLQVVQDMIRLAGLIMLTGGAMAAARAKPVEVAQLHSPVAGLLPLQIEKPQSQEVEEFAKLPLHIQRQALGYARRWTEAFFEPVVRGQL